MTERQPSEAERRSYYQARYAEDEVAPLIGELRRFYDLILIDCPPGDRWLTDSAFDSSEVSLLVGLPTDESARANINTLGSL